MARRSSEVTMGDIARMANVSESTVSRALSGSTLVAEKTRDRILEIARNADFAINEQARNLALRQTRTIEVIFPIERGTLQQVSDPFFVDMLAVLTDELGKHGYDVLMSRSPPWDEERPGCAFLGARADGVIFVGQGRHRSAIRDFARRHASVVAWGAVSADDDYCVIGSDNVGGGRLATEHMLKLGRKRIAFLGDTDLPEMRQRFEGYKQVLASYDIPLDEDLVIHTPFDIEKAREVTKPFVELFPRYDGIFACSDMIAMAAIANLRQAGIAVPDDVSVVGFDDIPSSAHVSPPITTVHQRIRHGGKVMVEKLIGILGGEAQEPEILKTELIIRQSCGARVATPS
ncbi:LacI family DNA-binding transcriptional regulator [Erythrobacter rubeus]|uniref:Substrate-binding domain-containing protein n=1 Tax=Erythrobacter rubeus TaxID=2760803 RepID=A0ABR8KR60_9SPHN|nr:substrate-binding domain-containing protein [Erythrobacter rubeus]MBD2841897.1 substrate-binding domain-containing protein [Erythrobacter rubeus]